MSFNLCLLFNSVTHTVFSGNQKCEILHHLLEHFGLPPSQIICFDREQKTFLQFSFWFQYLIQKFSPCQKGWRPEPFLCIFYLGEMTFVGSPCRWTGLGDFSRTDPCYQVWPLHAEHIATGITPKSNFLSDLKACLPDLGRRLSRDIRQATFEEECKNTASSVCAVSWLTLLISLYAEMKYVANFYRLY